MCATDLHNSSKPAFLPKNRLLIEMYSSNSGKDSVRYVIPPTFNAKGLPPWTCKFGGYTLVELCFPKKIKNY